MRGVGIQLRIGGACRARIRMRSAEVAQLVHHRPLLHREQQDQQAEEFENMLH